MNGYNEQVEEIEKIIEKYINDNHLESKSKGRDYIEIVREAIKGTKYHLEYSYALLLFHDFMEDDDVMYSSESNADKITRMDEIFRDAINMAVVEEENK